MDSLLNIGLLIAFLTEVILLARLEKVIWGTVYTPLNALALPFTFIVLLTLCLPSSLGFVSSITPACWFGWLVCC